MHINTTDITPASIFTKDDKSWILEVQKYKTYILQGLSEQGEGMGLIAKVFDEKLVTGVTVQTPLPEARREAAETM